MESFVAPSHTVLTFDELSINEGLAPELFSEESLGTAEN